MADIDPYAPCPHQPGSEGKVLWLQARFALGLPLFHPDDARFTSAAEAVDRVAEEAGAGGSDADKARAWRERLGRMSKR